MRHHRVIFTALLSLVILQTEGAFAQGETKVYGFFQGSAMFYNSNPSLLTTTTPVVETKNMGISQANLFVSKTTENGLTGFVNLEFVNNYSSDRGWGSFNLQEAFVRYDYRDYLTVKAGYFIPQFNSMYEMYNRTPLLPYLFRPVMYETQWGQVTNIFDVLPPRALFQLSGFVSPVANVKIDYSVHVGNPADAYIENRNAPDSILSTYVAYGQNASKFVSGGGRIGIRTGTLKAGVSYAYDYNNKRNFEIVFASGDYRGFGDLPRSTVGADLFYSVGRLSLTAEYLLSTTTLSASQKDSLAVWSQIPDAQVGKDLDVNAYFATLQYDIDDNIFVYGTYDHYKDNFRTFYVGTDGMTMVSAGAGYHFSDDLVLKGQIIFSNSSFSTTDYIGRPATTDLKDHYYLLGFSYAF